jgi:hypothetical protein
VDIEYTKLETWDAHRARSLCYGRRKKAQTTNKQSKQYLELKKKGMDAVSTTDNFEQVVREDSTVEVVEQRSRRRRGRGKEGGAKRNVRFWRQMHVPSWSQAQALTALAASRSDQPLQK